MVGAASRDGAIVKLGDFVFEVGGEAKWLAGVEEMEARSKRDERRRLSKSVMEGRRGFAGLHLGKGRKWEVLSKPRVSKEANSKRL